MFLDNKTNKWVHAGETLRQNARHYPDKIAWQDERRCVTFNQWYRRACQLAHVLSGLGIGPGDRVGMLCHNRGEWMDMYAACALGGQIAVPLMFRLSAPEIAYIINHADCRALIVEAPLVEMVDGLIGQIDVPANRLIYMGASPVPAGFADFEMLLNRASSHAPGHVIGDDDPWVIMYTSGTTGRPKGVVRTHAAHTAQHLVSNMNTGVGHDDRALLPMPMAHVNSLFYAFSYAMVGATVHIYNGKCFDPVHFLETLAMQRISFTSLVPTHYTLLLEALQHRPQRFDLSAVRDLLISSAPARRQLKQAIMQRFANARLWEAYGSTEGGLITLLRPEDQFSRIGTIGREPAGTDRIKILDSQRQEVKDGESGEIFFRTPMLFSGYLNDSQLTREAFADGWATSGDMGRRDPDGGYYTLIDRKAHMIISGGENIYPSEVERVLAAHPAVREVAVIGVPDDKWGEAVKAVVVVKDDVRAASALAEDMCAFCRGKLADFKQPKSISFLAAEEMPRLPTGKIQVRRLRQRFGC